MSFIIDHTPFWVWVVLMLAIVGPLMFYFGPAIIGVWKILPNWLKVTLTFGVSIIFAVLYGRNKGARDAKADRDAANARAIQTRQNVDHEVDNLPPADVDRRLGKWMRD